MIHVAIVRSKLLPLFYFIIFEIFYFYLLTYATWFLSSFINMQHFAFRQIFILNILTCKFSLFKNTIAKVNSTLQFNIFAINVCWFCNNLLVKCLLIEEEKNFEKKKKEIWEM